MGPRGMRRTQGLPCFLALLPCVLGLLVTGCRKTVSPEATALVAVTLQTPFDDAPGGFPNEPTGFRKVAWNTLLGQTKGMKTYSINSNEGLTWYTWGDEVERLGEVPLEAVYYGFSTRGEFVAGLLKFDESSYPAVVTIVQNRFGGPSFRASQGSRICSWKGTRAFVKLFPEKLVFVSQPFLGMGHPSYLQDIY